MTGELLAVLHGTHSDNCFADVSVTRADGYTAVHSSVPAGAWRRLNRRRVLRDTARRMALLEDLARIATVVPALPGSRLPPHAVPVFVRANRPVLESAVSHLKGRSQYQVVIAWDPLRAAAELAPRLLPGALDPYPVDAMRAAFTARVDALLHDVAVDEVALPQTQDIVVNRVLLVEESRVQVLEDALEAIDAIWSEGLSIRLVGPSPAVSLYSLAIRWIGADDVARARAHLGAPAGCDPSALAAARRQALRAGSDVDVVRDAEAWLAAHHRAGCPDDGVHIASRWSEGRAMSRPGRLAA